MSALAAKALGIPVRTDLSARRYLKGSVRDYADALVEITKELAETEKMPVSEIHVAYEPLMKSDKMPFLTVRVVIGPKVSLDRRQAFEDRIYERMAARFKNYEPKDLSERVVLDAMSY